MLLKGVKVVEYASYIAAPAAACMLGDWGADVVKVERPGGDTMRAAFADVAAELKGNPLFELDNRGKRSIVLDTADTDGREALIKLASGADVFITNVRSAALQRAGLDYEALRALNPRLIYAVVTGYGLEGPDAHRPGFDVTAFWARSGVGHMTAPKGVAPFMIRTGVGDHVTALATVSAITTALFDRERTGEGRQVATSLLASGVYVMGSDLSVQMKFGRVASGRTRDRAFDALANLYRSADDRWFLVNPRGGAQDWAPFCAAAGRSDLMTDERFATGRARRANASALIVAFDQAFAGMDFAEVARRLDEADLVWAPLQSPAEVAADPQVLASGAVVQVEDGEGGTFASPAAPVIFPGETPAVRPRAPDLGENTREVLSELGYGGEDIERLYAKGVVA